MNAEKTIKDYEALMNRALQVVDGAPYWSYISEVECARLTIDGDTATLTWPDLTMEYGESYLGTEACSFSASLLTMSDADFAVWKAEREEEYKLKQLANQRAAQEEKRRQELAALAALKAKYEGHTQPDPRPNLGER